MQNSRLRKQSNNQKKFSGYNSLIDVEQCLLNYNKWIVEKIFKSIIGAFNTLDVRVLDFGCGIGTLSTLLINDYCLDVEGVEIDENQREICRSKGIVTHESLDHASGRYDVIASTNVLEHIENDDEILHSIYEKLNGGGIFILYVPAFQCLWTPMDENVGHYRRYEMSQLKAKVKKAGFEITKCHYGDSIGFFLTLMFKFFKHGHSSPSRMSLFVYDKFLIYMGRFLDIFLGGIVGKNIYCVAFKAK